MAWRQQAARSGTLFAVVEETEREKSSGKYLPTTLFLGEGFVYGMSCLVLKVSVPKTVSVCRRVVQMKVCHRENCRL